MKSRNSPGNVLIAILLVLSINCDVTNPEPAPSVIQGSGYVNVSNHNFADYYFEVGHESYGYITFSYDKQQTWFDIEITAPYGIREGSGLTAPATGYTTGGIDVIPAQSYFFKPDSLHYGYLEITQRNINSTASVGFDWLIQTEPHNREFY